jgi:hypothetical protein
MAEVTAATEHQTYQGMVEVFEDASGKVVADAAINSSIVCEGRFSAEGAGQRPEDRMNPVRRLKPTIQKSSQAAKNLVECNT